MSTVYIVRTSPAFLPPNTKDFIKVNNTEKTYNKVFTSAVECCSHQLSCLDLKLSFDTYIRDHYQSISWGEGGREGGREGKGREGEERGRERREGGRKGRE